MNPQAALSNVEEILLSIVIILGSVLPFIIYHLIQRRSKKSDSKETGEQKEQPSRTEPPSVLDRILSRGKEALGIEERKNEQGRSKVSSEGFRAWAQAETSGRPDRGRPERERLERARLERAEESARLSGWKVKSPFAGIPGKGYSKRVIEKLEEMPWRKRAIVYAEIIGPPKALEEGTMSITNHADNKSR